MDLVERGRKRNGEGTFSFVSVQHVCLSFSMFDVVCVTCDAI